MSETAELDSVDWHILEELQNDATLPNRATWIATGNNPQLSGELTRRTVRIRVDAQLDEAAWAAAQPIDVPYESVRWRRDTNPLLVPVASESTVHSAMAEVISL